MSRFPDFVPSGVIPAVLLPFDDALAIDEPEFRRHLRDVAAVDRVGHAVVAERDAVAAADVVGRGPVLAGQHLREQQLRAVGAVAGVVDPADEVGADVLGRVAAQRVTLGVEPLVAELGEVGDDVGGLGRGDGAEARVRRGASARSCST